RTIEATSLKIITSRPKSINTDGELSTTTPAEFRVLPAQLKVFVPAARSSSVQSSSAQSNNPQSNNPQSNNLD
ncbi:MAG: hypothetical protein VKL01_06975, partial [Limnothrix sp.]|nr:hypothetical protein [Limnothrix sp.]